jgi:hypothetical protein
MAVSQLSSPDPLTPPRRRTSASGILKGRPDAVSRGVMSVRLTATGGLDLQTWTGLEEGRGRRSGSRKEGQEDNPPPTAQQWCMESRPRWTRGQ